MIPDPGDGIHPKARLLNRHFGWWLALRFAIQTVAAMLISYGGTYLPRLLDSFRAAYSALFVIQGSACGTFAAAAGCVLEH